MSIHSFNRNLQALQRARARVCVHMSPTRPSHRRVYACASVDRYVYTYSADNVRVAGGYTNSLTMWSFAIEEAREYWMSALKRDCATTGLCNWFLDSFSNMQFYPVSYKHGRSVSSPLRATRCMSWWDWLLTGLDC